MESNSFVKLFHSVIDSLNQFNIEYVLVGGTVMPYYGNVRSTQDIDIMIQIDQVSDSVLEAWLSNLKDQGLAMSISEIIEALHDRIHSTIFEPSSYIFRVDLKRIHSKLDYLTFANRKQVEIYDRSVWINCAESQIGVKMSDGFQSNTDIEDVISIVQKTELNVEVLSNFLNVTNSWSSFCALLKELKTEKSRKLLENLICETS